MSPFYRVDNRLVHGQIISTWVQHLRLKTFLVANDALSKNEFQMSMFRMAIPEDIEFYALGVEEAAGWLNEHKATMNSTMVLFADLRDAQRLFLAGHPFPRLNLGNIHHAPGRKAVTNAVYLGDEDIVILRELSERGVRTEVRSLPTESAQDLNSVLGVV